MNICVKCQVEMRPKENGVGAVEMVGADPYRLWDADLWACPACGVQAILGFGRLPVREQFHPDLAARISSYPTVIRFWSTVADKDRHFDARHLDVLV